MENFESSEGEDNKLYGERVCSNNLNDCWFFIKKYGV